MCWYICNRNIKSWSSLNYSESFFSRIFLYIFIGKVDQLVQKSFEQRLAGNTLKISIFSSWLVLTCDYSSCFGKDCNGSKQTHQVHSHLQASVRKLILLVYAKLLILSNWKVLTDELETIMGLACFGNWKDVVADALFVSEKLQTKEQKRAKLLHLREALNVIAKCVVIRRWEG